MKIFLIYSQEFYFNLRLVALNNSNKLQRGCFVFEPTGTSVVLQRHLMLPVGIAVRAIRAEHLLCQGDE